MSIQTQGHTVPTSKAAPVIPTTTDIMVHALDAVGHVCALSRLLGDKDVSAINRQALAASILRIADDAGQRLIDHLNSSSQGVQHE